MPYDRLMATHLSLLPELWDLHRTKFRTIFWSSKPVGIEEAYYGHFVLRLIGSFVLFYTSRVICKGRLTMEEIIFSLKHYWRFVDMEPLELQTLS